LPKALATEYPPNTVFRLVKPLYGLAESGLHWFATYQRHHKERLDCQTSEYDPCLLFSKIGQSFGIVGMQTDDTLNLATPEFLDKEEAALHEAGFKAKPSTILKVGDVGYFNGCKITVNEDSVMMQQKGQGDRLDLVKTGTDDTQHQYVVQRARGAYIATICQPEAAFDYSMAARAKDPSPEEIAKLNKRIQWQIDNAERGLRFIQLDLKKTALYVFVDGSFANNKDLSSQIGFIIVFGNERALDQENTFQLRGNILHWGSTKCKRVTRSVLASEIYGMAGGFDAAYVLKTTITSILQRLDLPPCKMVVCTDSLSLYQCLVQLGTTTEKRLMIDIMALRESYEGREIDEIRWIAGADNPADAMTKDQPNRALEDLVSTNTTTLRVEGWVKRTQSKK